MKNVEKEKKCFWITGGGNDALNTDDGKSIKLLKFIEHGFV